MNKEEKEYKSAVLQLQTALDFHNSNSLGEYNVNWKSVELILEYIKYLQKKAEQGEHYKHLYSEVKKQKDDGIKYIKEHIKYECDDAFNGMQFYSYHLYDFDKKELLRMLGENDE